MKRIKSLLCMVISLSLILMVISSVSVSAKKISAPSSVKLKAKTAGFTVKFKKSKSKVSGYKIKYSLKKNFSRSKTVKISAAKSSKTVKKLKQGKKYYVKVCAYKGSSNSKWTKAKSVKTLKKSYTAEDLVNKPVSKIAKMMGNKFSCDAGPIYTMYRFYNYKKFPGMDFYVYYNGDNISTVKQKIKKGAVKLFSIQVNGSGKGCKYKGSVVKANYDYTKCCKIFGKISCYPTPGAVGSGSLGAIGYSYKKSNYSVTVNFELNPILRSVIESGHGNPLSYDAIAKYNPKVKNIIIDKQT